MNKYLGLWLNLIMNSLNRRLGFLNLPKCWCLGEKDLSSDYLLYEIVNISKTPYENTDFLESHGNCKILFSDAHSLCSFLLDIKNQNLFNLHVLHFRLVYTIRNLKTLDETCIALIFLHNNWLYYNSQTLCKHFCFSFATEIG